MFQNPALAPVGFGVLARPNSGVVYMIAAMLLLPAGDTFTKLLGDTLNPVGVTLCHILAEAVFLLPIAFVLRHRLRGAKFSPVIALSGFLLIVSLTSLISAFAVMPITTAIAIFFVEPLILTLLAGFLLGETAEPRRLAAVGVGLIGAMIVIRPGVTMYGWATLLPLISPFTHALNMVVLKKATRTRSALTVQCGTRLYAAAGPGLLSLCLAAAGVDRFVPAIGDTKNWGFIVCAGAVAAVSFVLIAEAYKSAKATVLAPFQNLEIVTATASGFLVFGDFPDVLIWVGIAIILGSGVYIFHREGQSDTGAPRHKRAGRSETPFFLFQTQGQQYRLLNFKQETLDCARQNGLNLPGIRAAEQKECADVFEKRLVRRGLGSRDHPRLATDCGVGQQDMRVPD